MWTALIASAWLGAMGVFVATVSPTVFQTLSMPDASRFLRAYFPKLFRLEIGVGLAILITAILASNLLWMVLGVLIAAMAAFNLWVLTDRINQIADALAEAPENQALKRRFGMMHGASAGLFSLGGLACMWIVGQTAWVLQ